MDNLDIDFSIILDSVTIARSRKHIQKYYDIKDIGNFPKRLPTKSCYPKLTDNPSIMKYKEIYNKLLLMTMDVYAPLAMLLPSRFEKYENLYEIDLQSESRNANNFGQGLARQRHRESGLKKLMTINLLKRLESSVFAFRLSLSKLIDINQNTLDVIEKFLAGDKKAKIQAETNTYVINYLDDDEEDFTLTKTSSGKQINIDLNDLDVLTWKGCIENDIGILREIYAEMRKVKPDEDKKLGELKAIINDKIAHPLNENNKKILFF